MPYCSLHWAWSLQRHQTMLSPTSATSQPGHHLSRLHWNARNREENVLPHTALLEILCHADSKLIHAESFLRAVYAVCQMIMDKVRSCKFWCSHDSPKRQYYVYSAKPAASTSISFATRRFRALELEASYFNFNTQAMLQVTVCILEGVNMMRTIPCAIFEWFP